MLRELGSYTSLASSCEPEILQEGRSLRKEAIALLRMKYPDASEGALDFLIGYKLDEFASDPLHPEFEIEALKLIAS